MIKFGDKIERSIAFGDRIELFNMLGLCSIIR